MDNGLLGTTIFILYHFPSLYIYSGLFASCPLNFFGFFVVKLYQCIDYKLTYVPTKLSNIFAWQHSMVEVVLFDNLNTDYRTKYLLDRSWFKTCLEKFRYQLLYLIHYSIYSISTKYIYIGQRYISISVLTAISILRHPIFDTPYTISANR